MRSNITKSALKESIINAKQELEEITHTPAQVGFISRRSQLIRFINHMKRELYEK